MPQHILPQLLGKSLTVQAWNFHAGNLGARAGVGEGGSELLPQAAHREVHWGCRGGVMEQEVALRCPALCGTEQGSSAAVLLPGTSAVCESV